MTPATYNFPNHTKGDTFKGLSSLTITINSQAPTTTLASAKLQLRKTPLGKVFLELSSEDDTIIIEDSAAWEISIPKILIDIPPYAYFYDLQTIDENGDVSTYLKGTWTIVEDITR